ncbi:hypothetical protein OIO90_000499 [Microbotryomycetes sp. JL221]|nr:hypothetical protein OIO90_000499 [Microbotryomycetes sp. JL221]
MRSASLTVALAAAALAVGAGAVQGAHEATLPQQTAHAGHVRRHGAQQAPGAHHVVVAARGRDSAATAGADIGAQEQQPLANNTIKLDRHQQQRDAVGLDEALWSNKRGSLELEDQGKGEEEVLILPQPTPMPVTNPKWIMEMNAFHKRAPESSSNTEDDDSVFNGSDLETKLLVVTRGKVTVTRTITITKTRTHTLAPSATSTTRACKLTVDCKGLTIPANSHNYCDPKNKVCIWKCDKGYTAFAGKCVLNAGTSTTTRTTTTTAAPSSAPTLPGSPGPECFARYTNIDSGAVYGPGLGTFPMSPRPTSFVSRTFGQSQLMLDGQVYRVVGPNIYWLGLDENVSPSPSYPSRGRVREAMAIAVAMGANTVRSHTLGISTGNQYSVWPKAWQTNDKAFEAIDYAIWAARNYGLRLIIPLTDEHQYYHGGKYDFIRWAGLDTSNGYQFYTDYGVRDMFKSYIRTMLEHVNQFTGVAYKDDPTIMAWETGNELGAWMLRAGAPTKEWTEDIAAFIKSFAPNHLVADGTDGLIDESGVLRNEGVAALGVDLVTDHLYPALNWLLEKDASFMQWYTKNFFIGEFDWTFARGGDSPASMYSILEAQPYSGSMMWSVFGHDDQCCNWVLHEDGYSAYYPNGNVDWIQPQLLALVQHWHRMRGLTPPSVLPAVACPQPELSK